MRIQRPALLIFLLLLTAAFFSFPYSAHSQTCTDSDNDGYFIEGGACGTVDCDDSDPNVYPGAPKICDGKDNNCDGQTDFSTDVDADGDGYIWCLNDCNDSNPDVHPGATEICNGLDDDCVAYIPLDERDYDSDGVMPCEGDCDDFNALRFPGNTEICGDDNDNDCNNLVDYNDNCTPLNCPDADGDGRYNNNCTDGSYQGTDCDDNDANVYPGAQKICDGKDNNCDGHIDFSTDVDADGDGYIWCLNDCDDSDPNIHPGATEICNGRDDDCVGYIPADERDFDSDGFMTCTGDCDDFNAARYPGNTEICGDDIDNDCNNLVDYNDTCTALNCPDLDGDGRYDNTCTDGSHQGTDCDDTDANIYPGAQRICDGKDNDCDGKTDFSTDVDADGDGYIWCLNDCNDSDPAIHPGATEICNGLDDDCVGGIPADEGDYDSDGFMTCTGDCDDFNADRYPGNTEICGDNVDNDCNNLVDYADTCTPLNCPDVDGDGSFDINCIDGIYQGTDCDDNDPATYPGATRLCDGKDNDCDGYLDFTTDVDADADGYPWCAGDCDDSDSAKNPGMSEGPIGLATCSDGIDNDCDFRTDSTDADCASPGCYTRTNPKNGPHFFALLNPDDTAHVDSSKLTCGKCHYSDSNGVVPSGEMHCQRCHADPADTSDSLNGVLKAQYPLDPPYGYGSAPNVKMHSSTTVGTKYGSWTMGLRGCVTCHNPHTQEQDDKFGTGYGMYIKEYICYGYPATGLNIGENVEFTAASGPGSFADGPPTQGPNPPNPGLNYPGYPLELKNTCEICHMQTNHHRNDGSAPGDLDINGNYAGHYDGADCTGCHPHADGFAPTGGTAQNPHNTAFFNSNCQFCHVETQGVLNFSAKIPDTYCSRCHGERTTHTSDPARNASSSGNYTYDIACVDCHDPMVSVGSNRKLLRQQISSSVIQGSIISSTTVRGAGSLADGPPRNENICETCHSLTSHNRGDSTGDGIHADGNDYDGTYCMLCHDHNKSFMVPGPSAEE